jgi:hypothetical protein
MTMTIAECDAQLVALHGEYLAAIDADQLSIAAMRWIELHDLLDLRLHLPQQRTTDPGGPACASPG